MTAQLPPWKPPRLKPELLPASVEQAQEYLSGFVNRRAYTRQTDKPDDDSGKYFFYQARDYSTKEPLALDVETVRRHLTGEITIASMRSILKRSIRNGSRSTAIIRMLIAIFGSCVGSCSRMEFRRWSRCR